MLGIYTRKRKKKKFTKYRQYSFVLGNRKVLVQGYERQALRYLLDNGFDAQDIRCESEINFKIRYKYRKKYRDYFPDIYIPSARLIIEVKSIHTFGLRHKKKRGWSMTCAKAIACHKKGYRFVLLLMGSEGNRIKLPKNWAYMSKVECVRELDKLNREETLFG